MSNLIKQHLPGLRENTLPGFQYKNDFLFPQYDGQSILNIPSSVCDLLETPKFGAAPLHESIMQKLSNREVRKIVLILVDALSLHRLQRWMRDGTAPVWSSLIEKGVLAPLTSIVPSTTSAALTTLWTGTPPAVHGIAGYELWLKDYGVVANMIQHAPMTFKGERDTLSKAGFDPATFLPVSTLGEHLASNGVQAHAFQHYSIAKSGLSNMFLKQAVIHPFGSIADMWVSLRQHIESNAKAREYVVVYYGAVDGLSHIYGPDDERTQAEFRNFSRSFEEDFLNKINDQAKDGTLVMLTADHGQVTTPKEAKRELVAHPDLRKMLHINPTGENRLVHLHVQPGAVEDVRGYFSETWGDDFVLVPSEVAIESGLLGNGKVHSDIHSRLGDLVAIATGTAYLWWGAQKNPLLGRHGGLSSEEMLVPFLAAHL